jgi:hypothetical protein
MPVKRGQTRRKPAPKWPPKNPGSRIRAKPNSSKANFAGGWSDQALALLSTARSERSA